MLVLSVETRFSIGELVGSSDFLSFLLISLVYTVKQFIKLSHWHPKNIGKTSFHLPISRLKTISFQSHCRKVFKSTSVLFLFLPLVWIMVPTTSTYSVPIYMHFWAQNRSSGWGWAALERINLFSSIIKRQTLS